MIRVDWARELPGRPSGIPQSRPRGAKAAGLRYERALARALPAAKYGQWFEYRYAGRTRVCQTDLVLELDWGFLILEAKYTFTPDAWGQIALYKAVVTAALGRCANGMQVCRVLQPGMEGLRVSGDFVEAAQSALCGAPRVVFHWLGGVSPLLGLDDRIIRQGEGERKPKGHRVSWLMGAV